MSTSTTQCSPAQICLLTASTAWWAERFGRNPYENALNDASKIGSNTSLAAACRMRS